MTQPSVMKNTPDLARKTRHSLMPRSQSPLRALAIAMTVMCYLACLAIGAMILITTAVDNWTSEISSQMTVQIKPVIGVDMEHAVAAAEKILTDSTGILKVDVLDPEAGAKLLEPWIGSGALLKELPIPRLIALTIDQQNPPDVAVIKAELLAAVKGASLDTHQRWQAELTQMARTMKWLGALILLLIVISTVALVIYASRAALDANRDVVEVLHLVGATDGFIAQQVQMRFGKVGLQSGLLAAIAGIVTFFLMSWSGDNGQSSGLAQASRSMIYGTSNITLVNYLLFLLVPVAVTLICVITARFAILRILKDVH